MNEIEIYKKIKNTANIKIDSRNIEKGDIFWALKGDNFDANDFEANTYINDAIKNGAEFVVTDNPKLKGQENIIYTENTLQCLQKLALYHREVLDIPIIAITGTNGKTTTKELVNAVLKQKYNTGATQGNYNNHIGVPLTLLSFDQNTEIGVVEMGANHLNEIAELCQIAQPDFGIITNIGEAHLEGFGSFEGVVKAKTELYKFLANKPVFVNADDELLMQKASEMQKITYGKNADSDIVVALINSKKHVEMQVAKPFNHKIQSKLTGQYNLANMAVAVAVGVYFDISSEQIVEAIEGYTPSNNRSQIIDNGNSQIILDAYNANPSSMAVAIENVFLQKAKNIIIVLGDMRELGKSAKTKHEEVIAKIDFLARQNPQKNVILYMAGTEFFNANKPKPINNLCINAEKTTADLVEFLENKTTKMPDSLVLIKGSRAMKMETVLQEIKNLTA